MSAEPILLSKGPLSVTIEPDTGFVRHLRIGSREILRAAYVAVREDNWSTLPAKVSNLEVKGSVATWSLVTERGARRVEWRCSASLHEGMFRFEAEGKAAGAFSTNRTGLCVLHPPVQSGSTVVVEHPDGTFSRAVLPVHVSPHQPIRDIRNLHIDSPQGHLEVRFEGEVFEMEDQRNWSDDSYKTYCRPLDWPKPYQIKEGEVVRHLIEVRLKSNPEPASPAMSEAAAFNAPALGVLLGGPEPLEKWQVERLQRINPDFLAVWLDNNWQSSLKMAESLALPLQAHILGIPDEELYRELANRNLREVVLDHTASPEVARRFLKVPILAASRDNFTELNRQPPNPSLFDGVGFGINPQVHATDDRSIMETVATHGVLAANAKSIAMGKKVAVGPIGFSSRNQYDPRLLEPIASAWTLASFAHLAHADSVVYFRTHGTSGVIQPEKPPVEDVLQALCKAEEVQLLKTDPGIVRVSLDGHIWESTKSGEGWSIPKRM